MKDDMKSRAFLDGMIDVLGCRPIDGKTGEDIVDMELTLCDADNGCNCMTRTLKRDNTCMKCGAKKVQNEK